MMFEWDEQKAERNQSKHSVSFPFATRAFDDKHRVTVIDHRYDYRETRYIALAKIDRERVCSRFHLPHIKYSSDLSQKSQQKRGETL